MPPLPTHGRPQALEFHRGTRFPGRNGGTVGRPRPPASPQLRGKQPCRSSLAIALQASATSMDNAHTVERPQRGVAHHIHSLRVHTQAVQPSPPRAMKNNLQVHQCQYSERY